jgi:hypothetical protein
VVASSSPPLPEGVEEPVGIEMGSAKQRLRGHMQNWNDDPQKEKYADLPAVTITMPKGATLVLVQMNEDNFPETKISRLRR